MAVLLPTRRKARPEDKAAATATGKRSGVVAGHGLDRAAGRLAGGGHRRPCSCSSIGPDRRLELRPGSIVSGVVAVGLGVAFVWREATFATPLIPTTYWRRRNFMFPMGTKFCTSFAYFGAFFLFPLLMEQVFGYSVSQVGFLSVARPLVFAVSAPIAGYMTVRTGERNATLFGTSRRSCVSMVLFATLTLTSGLVVVVVVALALSGIGMGVSMPATSSTMSNELAESEYGVMSAAQLLATQIGEVAGIQLVLTIQESIAKNDVASANVHHSTGAPAQLQRPVLGRCGRGGALGRVRLLHAAAAPGRPGPGTGGRHGLTIRRPVDHRAAIRAPT